MNISVKIAWLSTLAFAVSQLPSAYAGGGVTGAIFTTIVNGTIVNANTQYTSKCAVYLDGGPTNGQTGSGLPAGLYYFQVTDPSGQTLLSTDPVSNRQFLVSAAGVISAYTGTGVPAPHPTGVDVPHAGVGAITIGLANTNCPTDFLDTPNNGGEYKVWVTPVGSFVGDPTLVDNVCAGDCNHGFVRNQSKTDNFKVQAGTASTTFCLSVTKQLVNAGGTITGAGASWKMTLTDPSGVQTIYYTNAAGTLSVCGLVAGTYTITESTSDQNGAPYAAVGLTFDGVAETVGPFYTFTFNWAAGDPAPTVVFQNLSEVG